MSEKSALPLSTGSAPEADLALIRRVMDEATRTAAMDGRYLVLWGLALAAAQAGTLAIYGLYGPAISRWINYLWWTAFAVGVGGSILLGFAGRHAPINLAVRLYRAAWRGFFLTMCILMAIAAFGKVIRFVDFMVFAPAITELTFFVSGAVAGFGWLRWIALGWWAAAVVFGLLGSNDATGILAIAVYLGLMALPGFLVMRQGRSR